MRPRWIPGAFTAGRGAAQRPNLGSPERFAGFFPAKSPRYVVVVVIGYPRGYYYGGLVAAPIFKAVGDRISYIDQLVFTGENNAP